MDIKAQIRNITDLGSFAVKNDGSEDFKKFVLEPLNEIRKKNTSFQYVGMNTEMYYGLDERGFSNCSYYYENFSRILTVQQVKDYLLSGVRPGEEKKQEEKSEVGKRESSDLVQDEYWGQVRDEVAEENNRHGYSIDFPTAKLKSKFNISRKQ